MLEFISFAVISLILLFAAFRVVTTTNLVHTVLWLGVTLGATAVVFVMLNSAFLATIQLLLYTGGILTLMLFGVMLTRRDAAFVRIPNPQSRRIAGALLAMGVLAMLGTSILRTEQFPNSNAAGASVAELGQSLFVEQVLAFEVLSVLLLVASLGAIVLARRSDAGTENETKGPLIAERKSRGSPAPAKLGEGEASWG